jgi:hypothetical protein
VSLVCYHSEQAGFVRPKILMALVRMHRGFLFLAYMIKIDIRSNIMQIAREFEDLQDKVKTKAIVRALNRTADQAKVHAARQIRDAGYKLPVGQIKAGIRVVKASAAQQTAALVCKGRPIPLINFSARETAKGVSVSVKGGRKTILGAFVATMPTGHRGVFQRVGSSHKRTVKGGKVVWSGLPIKELYGPSLPSAFANEVVQSSLQKFIAEKFGANFSHELDYLMGKAK